LGTGTITNNGVLVFKRADAMSINDAIDGTGLVKQEGAGTLTLTANNSYAGGTEVNAGTLAIGTDRNLGAVPATVDTDNIVLNGGALQLMSGFTQLHANRGITLGANDGTVITDSTVEATYGGVIAGAADFIKSGNGSLALSGTQTYTGTTTLTGTLSVTGSGSVQSGGSAGTYAFDIINNGQLVLDTSVDHAFSGVMSGSGSVVKYNTNTLALSGANTYSGGTTLQAGVIKLDQSSVGTAGSVTSGAIGTGNLVINDGAAMDLNGQSVLNVMSVAGEGVTQNGVPSGVLYNTNSNVASVGDAITLTADSNFKSNQGGGLNFASTFSGPHAVVLTGANNTLTHATPFQNSGSLTLGNAASDSFSFPNGLTVLTPSDIRVAGSVSSNNAALSLGDANTHPSIQLLADTTLNAGTGTVTLGGAVSGNYDLQVIGPVVISGGSVNTGSAAQDYSSTVTLDNNTTFTASNIHFGDSISGAGSLIVNAAVTLDGSSVTTVGAQSYQGAVVLNADNILTAGDANNPASVSFARTIDGAHALTINSSGVTTFHGAIGDNTPLDSVTTDAGGTLNLNGGAVTTTGAQTYGESVILGTDTTLSGNTISFASTVNGPHGLTLTDSGVTTLSAAIGDTAPLTTLSIHSVSVQLSALTTTGDATIVTGDALQFDNTNVGGAFSVTTGRNGAGGVSQVAGSTMTVAGNAVFTADTALAQDAALNNAGNDFQGTVAFRHANNGSWRDVAIVDSQGDLALADVAMTGHLNISASGAVALGSSTNAGTLTLQANGNVTQAGPLVVAGAASIDAGTGTVTLSDDANDFGSTLTLTAASATIVDGVGGLELGNVQTTVGSLSVRSDRGAITQAASSSIVTAGQSSFTASLNGQGKAAADIELSNAGNDFGGVVDIDGAAVSVVDTGALQLGDVRATGNLAITAAGDVAIDFAQIGGTMNVDTGGGDMTLGQVTVAGNTSIATQGGSIAQTGIVQLQSDVSLDADTGAITLSNLANSFGGQLTLNGGSTTIANTGNLTLGTVYNRGSLTLNSQGTLSLSSATTVQGDLTLYSQGDLTLGSANIDGSLSLNSGGGDVTIGSASVASNFSVVSSGGAITQTAAFNVLGTANFDAGTGSIDLSNAGNNFVGAVSLTAGTATIADSNALVLGTLAITGSLDAQVQGDLTLGSGQVGGTLTATSSSGDITQQPAGLAVTGQMDLTATTGNIVLDAVANSFDGAVSASAAWVELRAASALTLGTLLATDSALVQSTGLLTLGQVSTTNDFSASGAAGIVQLAASALSIGGETSFVSAGGNVVLDQPANQFVGAMTLEANAATIKSASALILDDVITLGDLTLQTTGGSITQAAGATMTANGKTTLVAKQGGADAPITLANTGNNFVGAVAITGSTVKLRDDTGSLKLGNIRTSGMLDAMARGGPIMFEPGTLQLALGGMILTPDPRPSGIDFPRVRPESLASSATMSNTSAAASSASSAGRAGLTVMATEQTASNTSGQGAVIKISEAPMWQATRNVIPVGKVVALDTAASNNRVIASASFEIVDGFASGMTTIEVGGGQAVPASVDNNSGKVTLNGTRSVSDYDKAIRDIKLRMGADVPPNAVFRIKITLTDQSGRTESKTVTLQVNQPEVVSRNP
jgi:autotransporter-associated beta strand protein